MLSANTLQWRRLSSATDLHRLLGDPHKERKNTQACEDTGRKRMSRLFWDSFSV